MDRSPRPHGLLQAAAGFREIGGAEDIQQMDLPLAFGPVMNNRSPS